jgi:hypothetical protein
MGLKIYMASLKEADQKEQDMKKETLLGEEVP